ncbi:MAG: hypothetical protein SV422_04650, partial [Pseudomonadota bacterium]|nr:hypothetical protein [Pseudomonadota bacterium]
MTSASPDDERELPSLPPRRIAGAVIVSLSVHGAALLGLMRMTMSDADAHMAVDPPSISVALVTRTPRLSPPEPPEPEPPIESERSAREIPLETAETAMSPETELAEALEPALPPETGEAVPPVSDAQDSEASAATLPPGQQRDDDDATAPWTPARIRAALDAGRGERQSDATADWLTACFLEQKQRGMRDCTQQQQAIDYATDNMRAGRAAAAGSFATVTRPQLQARLSEQFRSENLRLAELMEEGGEVGALASQRYYINLEYFRYLNGNGQAPLFSAMQN